MVFLRASLQRLVIHEHAHVEDLVRAFHGLEANGGIVCRDPRAPSGQSSRTTFGQDSALHARADGLRGPRQTPGFLSTAPSSVREMH